MFDKSCEINIFDNSYLSHNIIDFKIHGKLLYMIFQYGWEPVLSQHRIFIGFEAIVENKYVFVTRLLFNLLYPSVTLRGKCHFLG